MANQVQSSNSKDQEGMWEDKSSQRKKNGEGGRDEEEKLSSSFKKPIKTKHKNKHQELQQTQTKEKIISKLKEKHKTQETKLEQNERNKVKNFRKVGPFTIHIIAIVNP